MENKKMSSTTKYCILMPLVMAVLYFVAIANLPYGYYTFLRVFSLIFLGIFILAYCTTCSDLQISMLNFPNVAAGAIIVLFNPIFPIYMDKSTWIVFDAISAIIMIAISIFIFMQYSRGSEK